MTVYWIMFALPALAVLMPLKANPNLKIAAWLIFGLFLTLIIGLRYQVGGDWSVYLNFYDRFEMATWQIALESKDIGYGFLNWFSEIIGGEIYLVNIICAGIVVFGLVKFCLMQPLPWLAMLVAVPYLLIVVSMGYTRQSAALGFCFLAIAVLMDKRTLLFVFLVLCGVLFHKSAILLLPIAALATNKNRFWTLVWTSILGLGLVTVVLVEHFESLVETYVVGAKLSEGSDVRVAMNALPAILLLLFKDKLAPNVDERRIWIWIAIMALTCVPLVNFASTAVDRVSLYFIPIQLYVYARIHRIFDDRLLKTLVVIFVVLGYGLVQWIWLNHAFNAFAWLPYQFAPFVSN